MGEVSELQKQIAMEKADALITLFRDGVISLVVGKAEPEKAIPILNRLTELLRAAGKDPEAIIAEAIDLAPIEAMRGM